MDNTVIVAIISLVGVVVTALVTKDNFSRELDKKIAVIETKLDGYGKDIQSHNHYAKLFAESMPVVQEQIKVVNHRLEDLEKKVG